MNLFKIKKISLENLSNIERLFALCLSSNPERFQEEIKDLYEIVGEKEAWEFAKIEKSINSCQKLRKNLWRRKY